MSGRGATTVGCWPGANTENPFVETYCAALRAAGLHVVDIDDPTLVSLDRLDVLHIHWPESVFWAGGGKAAIAARVVETLRTLARARKRGLRIVWMVHNLHPHDMSERQAMVWSALRFGLCRLVDGFMTLSPSTIDVVRARLPGLRRKPATYIWHPAYTLASNPSREAARARLATPAACKVFAFVGLIRPYKGVLSLLEAFSALPGAQYRLWLNGLPSDAGTDRELRRRAGSDDRVALNLEFLSDATLLEVTRAADCVVIPLRKTLHSGSLVYALSAGARVVTPRTPFASDLDGRMGGNVVQMYDGELSADILNRAIPANIVGSSPYTCPGPQEAGARAKAFYDLLACAK